MGKYPTDRELTPNEFANVMDDILREIGHGLPEVAGRFFEEKGRGALWLNLYDAPVAKDRRMGIGYTTPTQVPDHKYLKRLLEEYDPASEAVIFCTTKKRTVEFVRHLKFQDLTGASE